MRKRRKNDEEVTLNITAMLDMAFQLLAFFVLTFRPPPPEAQIYLKLPPALPVLGLEALNAGENTTIDPKEVKTTKTLMVNLLGEGTNYQVSVGIPGPGKSTVPTSMDQLEQNLRRYFKAKDEASAGGQATPIGDYEQVVVNASPTVPWEVVMKVVDMCARLSTVQGDNLPTLSFSVAGEDPGG